MVRKKNEDGKLHFVHSKRFLTPICKNCNNTAAVTYRGYCDREECDELLKAEMKRDNIREKLRAQR